MNFSNEIQLTPSLSPIIIFNYCKTMVSKITLFDGLQLILQGKRLLITNEFAFFDLQEIFARKRWSVYATKLASCASEGHKS